MPDPWHFVFIHALNNIAITVRKDVREKGCPILFQPVENFKAEVNAVKAFDGQVP